MLIRLRRHKIWNKSYISNQAVFSKWQESQDKNLNIWRIKRAFTERFLLKIRTRFLLIYNLGQNICRLFQFLEQFFFTTSEMDLDYYHQKVSVQVASRVAELHFAYKLNEWSLIFWKFLVFSFLAELLRTTASGSVRKKQVCLWHKV